MVVGVLEHNNPTTYTNGGGKSCVPETLGVEMEEDYEYGNREEEYNRHYQDVEHDS